MASLLRPPAPQYQWSGRNRQQQQSEDAGRDAMVASLTTSSAKSKQAS
jgi:hypothetical protein